MLIKQQKVRAMKDNDAFFLLFSPTFSSNSGGVTHQSLENSQVAGGRRGRWVVVVVGVGGNSDS